MEKAYIEKLIKEADLRKEAADHQRAADTMERLARSAFRAGELRDEERATENFDRSLPLNEFFDEGEIFGEQTVDAESEVQDRVQGRLSQTKMDLSREISNVILEKSENADEMFDGIVEKVSWNNFASTVRTLSELDDMETEYSLMMKIARQNILERDPTTRTTRTKETDFLKDRLDAIEERREKLAELSPESYTAVHGLEFRSYIDKIKKGALVTTPYVEKNLKDVMSRMEVGRPSFIHGHLGSGKTEIAMMAARKVMMQNDAFEQAKKDYLVYTKENPNATKKERRKALTSFYKRNLTRNELEFADSEAAKKAAMQDGAFEQARKDFSVFAEENPNATEEERREAFDSFYKKNLTKNEQDFAKNSEGSSKRFEPLVIAGSGALTAQDIYVDKVLSLAQSEKSIKEGDAEIEKELKDWEERNKDKLAGLSDEERVAELAEASYRIIELYKLNNQAYGTVVEKVLKPIAEGVTEGRPVIIDEANSIPPAVMISLNDLLNKRPGQSCFIPTLGQVKIKPGFSITMTGNLSTGGITYFGTEKLNPATRSRLRVIEHDYPPMSQNDTGYEKQVNPNENELFQIIIAHEAERQGRLEFPEMEKSLEKLFNLAQLARQTHLIFADKWRESVFNKSLGSNVKLNESVLSIRNLYNVLESWNRGHDKSLDEALWDGFISEISDPNDQTLILVLAKRLNFFEKKDGWKVESEKNTQNRLRNLSEIRPGGPFKYVRKPIEVMNLRETIDMLYGKRPERKNALDGIELETFNALNDIPSAEELMHADERLNKTRDLIGALEVLSEQCGCNVEGDEA